MSDTKPKYKEINGQTRVGTALRWLANQGKNIAPELLSIAGTVTGIKSLELLGEKIKSSGQLSEEDKEFLLQEIEFDYIDLRDARDMQKVALKQDDLFSKRFVYYLATAVFAFSGIIVLLLFFVEIPEKNRDVVNFILGVVVGTGLTGVFQYFFGSSKGSKDKYDALKLLDK